MAQRRADRAELLDHFGWLSFEVWGRLTPRQVEDYLRHARDEESGQIRRPQGRPGGPATCAEHVAAYRAQVRASNSRRPGAFPPEAVAAKVAQIEAHWQKKEQNNGDRRA